jgi:hypothetical protein
MAEVIARDISSSSLKLVKLGQRTPPKLIEPGPGSTDIVQSPNARRSSTTGPSKLACVSTHRLLRYSN